MKRDTDLCADCGKARREHSYNGACYGLCGEFVEGAPIYCSFCGKANREAEVMLGGIGMAFICSDCVDLAVRAIAEKRSERKLQADVVRCAFCQPTPLQSVASA
jgi:hypothetical protein